MQNTQDEIRRKMMLKAPLEKVWTAIATPGGFEGWFKCKVSGLWEVGKIVTLTWPSGSKNEIRIVALNPQTDFHFQWHPGSCLTLDVHPENQLTTVMFYLRPGSDVTEMEIVESGFANVPEDRRAEVLALNSEGWDEEMENIRTYVEA